MENLEEGNKGSRGKKVIEKKSKADRNIITLKTINR